jgi:pSer/pThr/pTyr-binding forkhead associated (FHA) protein
MGTRYTLGETPVVLGRDEDCHINLADDSDSRKHACVQPECDG